MTVTPVMDVAFTSGFENAFAAGVGQGALQAIVAGRGIDEERRGQPRGDLVENDVVATGAELEVDGGMSQV